MTNPDPIPPDYYCPNPDLDCPGQGADLQEIRQDIRDSDGTVLGTLIFMACRRCGYRWDRS